MKTELIGNTQLRYEEDSRGWRQVEIKHIDEFRPAPRLDNFRVIANYWRNYYEKRR